MLNEVAQLRTLNRYALSGIVIHPADDRWIKESFGIAK